MDKLWIKIGLVVAFAIALIYVFVNASRVLEDPPRLEVKAIVPSPPTFTAKPKLPAEATADQYAMYLKQSQEAAAVDKQAVDMYVAQVTAYGKDVEAQIVAAKAAKGDRSGRVTAFEKAIKDTIGQLIVAPLLAALLLYSGIKVAGDVAMARATNGAQKNVDAP